MGGSKNTGGSKYTSLALQRIACIQRTHASASKGRISLTADSLENQFIVGRYGSLPYGVCRADIPIRRVFMYSIQSAGMDTCPTYGTGKIFYVLLGQPLNNFCD